MEEEKGKGNERWNAAIANLTEMSGNLESLQKLLLKKAVFVDEETFSKASLISEQARTIKVSSFPCIALCMVQFLLILQLFETGESIEGVSGRFLLVFRGFMNWVFSTLGSLVNQ